MSPRSSANSRARRPNPKAVLRSFDFTSPTAVFHTDLAQAQAPASHGSRGFERDLHRLRPARLIPRKWLTLMVAASRGSGKSAVFQICDQAGFCRGSKKVVEPEGELVR